MSVIDYVEYLGDEEDTETIPSNASSTAPTPTSSISSMVSSQKLSRTSFYEPKSNSVNENKYTEAKNPKTFKYIIIFLVLVLITSVVLYILWYKGYIDKKDEDKNEDEDEE